MNICIKQNELNKTLLNQAWATSEYALKKGYKIIQIEEKYLDCQIVDFNEDLTFNVDKYNSRKTKEQAIKRILELKALLKSTDYQAIKYAEGEITLENYLPIKLKRASYRAEINSLEEKIKNMA